MSDELFDEVKKGNLARAQHLISGGADVNADNGDGWTPLLYGAMNGHGKVAKALLAAGADVHATSLYGKTALMLAKNADVAKVLLDAGAKPDVQNTDGWSALHFAVIRKRKDVVNVLIDVGVNTDIKAISGWMEGCTPREFAVQQAELGRTEFKEMVEVIDAATKARDARRSAFAALRTARRVLLLQPTMPALVVDTIIVHADARCVEYMTMAQRHEIIALARVRPLQLQRDEVLRVLRQAAAAPVPGVVGGATGAAIVSSDRSKRARS